MSVKAKNFAVVQLPVKDLERSVNWYRSVLGLDFTFEFKPGDNEAWLNVGGVGLGLIKSPEIPKFEFYNLEGAIQPVVQFQVDHIHEVYKELKGQGVEVSEMIYKKGGGYSFNFRDPDGHLGSLWGGWPPKEDE